MDRDADISHKLDGGYEIVPPEGGWGYAIMLAVSLIFTVTIVPASFFGAVFGPFVSTLGDEIGATTLIMGVFNTTLFLTGLPANHLLQNYTYRKVALIGAVAYFSGSFLAIFSNSVFHLVVSYGFLQGFGFGLALPAGFTAIHEYFVKRENVIMSVCQTIIGAMGMIWPIFTSKLMTNYGFRGTAAIFSALSLHLIVAASVLQPAKWHYKKKSVTLTDMEMSKLNTGSKTNNEDRIKPISEESNYLMQSNVSDIAPASKMELDQAKKRETGKLKSIVESLDLVLFKDVGYVNLTIGASMAMTSDVLFISIIPVVLGVYGFDESNQTLILTVFFSADLVGRTFLCFVNGLFRVWNRYVVLTGAVLSTIFRIAFTLNYSFWWTIITCAALGFLRCGIQICFPLVFAEKYGARFTTAFSLNMVVCGIIAFSVGIVSGWVKHYTGSNIMVVHLLTMIYGLCAILWLVEICIVNVMNRKI